MENEGFGKVSSFRLERYFAKHEFSAKYLLCASDAQTMRIDELLALEPGSEKKFLEMRLGYTESQGSPSLRNAIAELYEDIGPDEIVVTSGAEEAIFLFVNAALTRKDRVVVETPCYQSLYELARLNCDAVKWDLEQAGGAWRVDVGSLANCGKLDAMIVNSPHNPTGHQFGKGEFEEIVDIARKNDAILFSDEVYRLLEYKKSCRLPAACDVYDKAVSLGVMSKAFGLAGLRIGWIATKDAKLRRRVSELKDYTTICNSAPSEFLAEIAIKNRELVVGRALRIVKKNLGLLNSFFSRHGGLFGWKAPKAGTVAFPEIKAGGSDEFCRKLLGRKGVLLAPSSEFAFGDGNFRVGFGRQDMPEALGRLEEFVDENA